MEHGKRHPLRKAITARHSAACLACILLGAGTLGADPAPGPAVSPRLAPGKTDLLAKVTREASEVGFMWWTPFAKLGATTLQRDVGGDVRLLGGYVRPFLGSPGRGELVLGGNLASFQDGTDYEAQAEYRHPTGVSLGAGFFDRRARLPGAAFVKSGWRGRLGARVDVIAMAQMQRQAGEWSPGAYAALSDARLMLVGGHDGEQWRATLGWVAPETRGAWRPAAEVLYVDNDAGRLRGPRFLFANATFGFRGGFLSHAARLGRAMGPQGLEFGNPLGFVAPSWNRRLETWELGELGGLRVVRTRAPGGRLTQSYEGLVYPAQLAGRRSGAWSALFLGAAYDSVPGARTRRLLAGASARAARFAVSGGLYFSLDGGGVQAALGVVRRF